MNSTKWIVAAALALVTAVPSAQQPGFTRAVLQDQPLSTSGRHAVVARAEFVPGGQAGKHTHPGEESGYIIEGSFLFEMDGKPPVTLKAGDTFFVPPGTPHNATNSGTGKTRVLATYTVEKGKPLATPVTRK